MVTAQGHAGRSGKLPGTSCADESSKVQYPVCSCQRYFLATADLQVSFEVLKTPDPLWHSVHFGGVFTIELRDHRSIAYGHMIPEFQTSVSQLQCPFSQEQPRRAKLRFL